MNRARLIKKDETANRVSNEMREKKPPRVKKRREVITEWIDKRRQDRKDPRKDFAALFTQPQISWSAMVSSLR